ncbi:MerR family transcriptional regulator [Limnohabitans sp. B9-3]|uniref:MerR family transcriptional regulator n=1 Tax=Limnohabitans sp. B9-3 TaxID=1100707 RepID=UPI0013045A58|nr:MerR family transcriptional regulator [Limnohabitans sp. B9-3]
MSNTSALPTTALYRIGAVSKTAGIPVSTLRIWETRYGAFTPVKTEGKQRLFAEHDVSKALLLKQLSQNGHAISTIANLDLEQLRRMSNLPHHTSPSVVTPGLPVSLAVVGLSMANRIESQKFAAGLKQNQIKVTDVLQDLSTASQAELPQQPQVLLVKVNTLQTTVHTDLQALVAKHKFAQTIVIYNFATDAVVQAMKFSGFIVRREPISDIELAELLQSVLFVDPERAQEFGTTGAVIAARKYSDATLSRVAGISTNVLCECPRHVAELIAQLASFEQYSQECLNRNAEDSHLHAYLRSISGSARSLFENALEKIAAHEGIDLRDDVRPQDRHVAVFHGKK